MRLISFKYVAIIRCIIISFTTEICKLYNDDDEIDANTKQLQINQLLEFHQLYLDQYILYDTINTTCSINRIRSFRMLFLQCLYKNRGLLFLRSILQLSNFATSKWLKQWKDSQDEYLDIIKLIGENKLPNNNPYKNLLYYDEIHHLVISIITNSSTISQFHHQFLELYTISKQSIIGTLLAIFFQEIYLLQVIQCKYSSSLITNISHLIQWIQQQHEDLFTNEIKQLLIYFIDINKQYNSSFIPSIIDDFFN